MHLPTVTCADQAYTEGLHRATLQGKLRQVNLYVGPGLAQDRLARFSAAWLLLRKQFAIGDNVYTRNLTIMFEPNPAIQRLDTDRAYGTITFDGVIHRTGFLLVLTGLAYYLTWQGIQAGSFSSGAGIAGSIVGLVLALIIIFTKSSNPVLISCYAAAEGVALGSISYLAEIRYPGIAAQATAGTMGCFLAVLLLYRTRILKASPAFTKILLSAMLGITLLYVGDFISGLFGHPFSMVHGNSSMSIGVSVIIVLVAALSFVIDFAQIEEAVQSGADARFAWRCSFGLIVGLVWLYMEILRLLMKSRSRN